MNRAMIIGAVDAGKSTLTHALLETDQKAVKTQSLSYLDWIVDTPGEYTENPLYYKNIMATSLEVTHVIYLQDPTNSKMIFPPGFSSGFSKLPIGVVTKADHPNANIEFAIDQLKRVVTEGPIVVTSAVNKQGLKEIRDLVQCNSLQEMKQYVLSSKYEHIFFHETIYNSN